jgi:hypothetical protein
VQSAPSFSRFGISELGNTFARPLDKKSEGKESGRIRVSYSCLSVDYRTGNLPVPGIQPAEVWDMNVELAEELVDALGSSLEDLEASQAALIQFLKDQGIVTDEQFADYRKQASKASSVRWRAARVRLQHLIEGEKAREEKAAEEKKREEQGEEKKKKEEKAPMSDGGDSAAPRSDPPKDNASAQPDPAKNDASTKLDAPKDKAPPQHEQAKNDGAKSEGQSADAQSDSAKDKTDQK